MEDTFVSKPKENKVLPKHAYDMEYSTQTRKEYEYLKEHGFEPTYVRVTEYGIKTYKYTKTPALFETVAEFYRMKLEQGAPVKKVQIYAD